MRPRASASPGLGIDIVELGGADQSVHCRRPHTAAVGTAEQPGFPAESDTAQAALGGIVREVDAAVLKEAGKAVPALQHVVHCRGYRGVAREPARSVRIPLLRTQQQAGRSARGGPRGARQAACP